MLARGGAIESMHCDVASPATRQDDHIIKCESEAKPSLLLLQHSADEATTYQTRGQSSWQGMNSSRGIRHQHRSKSKVPCKRTCLVCLSRAGATTRRDKSGGPERRLHVFPFTLSMHTAAAQSGLILPAQSPIYYASSKQSPCPTTIDLFSLAIPAVVWCSASAIACSQG